MSNAYAYNGLDQRSGKADSGGTFSFLRSGDGIDSPVLSDGAATYNYGSGLTSEVRGGTSKFYQADGLGSTRELTNSAGAVTDAHETDAFGNTVASSGSTPSPFGFAGQAGYQTDSDTGLKLLGHRYYDASTGRFISRDPIQDGNNWYVYCNNDPVNGLDPSGLFGTVSPEIIRAIDLAGKGRLGVGTGPWMLIAEGAIAVADLVHYAATGETNGPFTSIGQGLADLIPWAEEGPAPATGGAGARPPSSKTPVGHRGKPLAVPPGTNSPDTIDGREYSGHALDRMQERGLTPSVVEDTIANGTPEGEVRNNSQKLSTEQASVVVDVDTGRVVTVIPR